MSGVRAMSQAIESVSVEDLDVPEMVDILYDIVATGVEPKDGATVTQIEQFLHEHAREPRGLKQFQDFFTAHAIERPRQPEAPAPLRVIAPLPAPEAPVEPVADVDAIRRANEPLVRALPEPAMGVADVAELELIDASPRRNQRILMAVAIAAVALLGVGLGVLVSLHQDLESARTQAAVTQQTLASQQAREIALEQELNEDRQLLHQLKEQSDQLIRDLHPTEPVAQP